MVMRMVVMLNLKRMRIVVMLVVVLVLFPRRLEREVRFHQRSHRGVKSKA